MNNKKTIKEKKKNIYASNGIPKNEGTTLWNALKRMKNYKDEPISPILFMDDAKGTFRKKYEELLHD